MKPKLYLPVCEQPVLYRIFAGFLSSIYSNIINIRNLLYNNSILRSTRLPGVCISVGNLTVGGTGKSPFVMELAQNLIAEGKSPVILTRGYKSSLGEKDILVLLDGNIWKKNFSRNSIHLPDEASMYSHKLPTTPIIIARDRVKAAKWFLMEGGKSTHWILDDGFQHRKLHRDVDIVLLDAEKPFGNGKLLPLGSLREDLRSLKRAHFICFTRAGEFPLATVEAELKRYTTAPTYLLSFDFSIRPLDKTMSFSDSHEPVCVMCGIAHPEKFLAQIQEKNIRVGNTYIVGDHECFDPKKIQNAIANCKSLLTTEKDYWRKPSLFEDVGKPCFIAELHIRSIKTDKPTIFKVLSLI